MSGFSTYEVFLDIIFYSLYFYRVEVYVVELETSEREGRMFLLISRYNSDLR